MNRLNNITGRGAEGFPVSTEVIEVLHDYRTFIEVILGGLNLPGNSCILLKYTAPANYNPGTPYINDIIAFITPDDGNVMITQTMNFGRGRLCKINNVTGFSVSDLVNGTVDKSIQIVETPHKVIEGEGEQEWENVYYTVSAKLGTPTLSFPKYKFYRLSDLIQFKI